MNRLVLFGLSGGLAVALLVVAVRPAESAGQGTALVRLQATTPGTVQTGNVNVSGTVVANKFKGNGSLLTNLPAFQLPFSGLGNSADALFLVENADTGPALAGYSSTMDPSGGIGLQGLADGPGSAGVMGASYDPNAGYGGYFTSDGNAGVGVYGLVSGPSGLSEGGRFEVASTSGIGMRGVATAVSGLTYGGYFQTASQSGRAVFGVATANTLATTGGRFEAGGIGVLGRALATSGFSYGMNGVSISPDGTGVFGNASSTSGATRGGRFDVASPDGIAVVATNLGTGTSNQPAGHFRNLATAGNNWGVLAETQSGSGVGVSGLANAVTGGAYGVYGRSAGLTGIGVAGVTTSLSGSNRGVLGQSASTDGAGVTGTGLAGTGLARGVEAFTNSSAGQALYAEATATGGLNYAGYFKNPSQVGNGIWVESTGESGKGMTIRTTGRLAEGLRVSSAHPTGPNKSGIFVNASSLATVLEATSLATSGNTFSFAAFNNSPTGTAIWATNDATTGTTPAVFGRTSSIEGVGVSGQAPGQPSAYALFAFGNTGANGLKSFVIDHPLDPANKVLKHFCTEGEQPLNVYSGNIRTDSKGFATVELPDYFDEINRDARYQLTVVDDSDDFVLVKVSKPVKNGQFVIRSSQPGILVSWRVEGVRNDAWVRRVGAQAVSQKPESQRGRYYDPESYGLSPEQGIGYRLPPKGER